MEARARREVLAAGASAWQARLASARSPLRGVLLDAPLDPSDPDARVRHVLPLMSGHSVLTGWAAARWHGVVLLDGRGRDGRPLDVTLASPGPGQHRHRPGVRGSRTRLLAGEHVTVRGVRCATLARAVYDEMRTCRTLDDAVAVLDLAVCTLVDQTRTTLDEVDGVLAAHPGERGVALSRRAVRLACTRSTSAWQSRTRVLAHEAGLDTPAVNVPLFDRAGTLLDVVELVDPRTGLVVRVTGTADDAPCPAASAAADDALRRAGCTVMAVGPTDHVERERAVWRLRRALRDAERSARRSWTLQPPSWWTP